jgi:hypothetical protein
VRGECAGGVRVSRRTAEPQTLWVPNVTPASPQFDDGARQLTRVHWLGKVAVVTAGAGKGDVFQPCKSGQGERGDVPAPVGRSRPQRPYEFVPIHPWHADI